MGGYAKWLIGRIRVFIGWWRWEFIQTTGDIPDISTYRPTHHAKAALRSSAQPLALTLPLTGLSTPALATVSTVRSSAFRRQEAG